MILDQILQIKHREVKELLTTLNVYEMERQIQYLPPTRDFKRAIHENGRVNLIAEVKRQSPSKGVLCPNFNHRQLAKIYQDNGTAAISVLTDATFFGGKLKYLQEIREIVDIPLLRKDFIIAPVQVYQSRLAGADAILLIASVLDDVELNKLYSLARSIGLQVLVEVHTAEELKRVLAIGVEIIGINNRDLKNFTTDLTHTAQLVDLIDLPGITIVSESGINTGHHMDYLKSIGVNAALVGEALVTAADTSKKARELIIGGREGIYETVRVKICGIKDTHTATAAARAGADAIGMVFAKSTRQVTPEKAKEICQALPPMITRVGVFVDTPIEEVKQIAGYCGLDIIQLHGDESPGYCKELGLRSIKAVQAKDRLTLEQACLFPSSAILVDTYLKGTAGGTGQTFNWRMLDNLQLKKPLILAGGLNPGNVGRAVALVRPYGVDVSSGVEVNGKKDIKLIQAFIKRAREVCAYATR